MAYISSPSASRIGNSGPNGEFRILLDSPLFGLPHNAFCVMLWFDLGVNQRFL
jgi:hypothetical protein